MSRRLLLLLGALSASMWFVAPATAAPPDPTNPVFSFVDASSLAVDWQGIPGPTTQFIVSISSTGSDTIYSSTTVMLTSTFTALTPNKEFFAVVFAQDTLDSTTSSSSTVISTFTLANDPITLSTSVVSFTGVDLSWDANGNPDGTIYNVERSTDGSNFSVVFSQTATTVTDGTITPGLSYVYQVRAFNNLNVPTGYTNTVSVTIPGSASNPRPVPGITATRTTVSAGVIRIDYIWNAVTTRANGTVLSNFAGYDIYTSTSLLTPRGQWITTTTVLTEAWSVTTDGSIANYYTWLARDTDGQTSDWGQVLDDSADLNHFYLADDSISRLQLPASAAAKLLRSGNHYGSDLDITVTEVPSEETGSVAKSMVFSIFNYDTELEVTDITFDPPVLRGTIAYTVENGEVVQGAPRAFHLGVPLIAEAQEQDGLSLFWHNGNAWVKTTGVVNTADNTISFTGSRIGRYQIRAASHVAGLIMTRAYPRIITPNDDGWNDKAVFEFDNPQLSPLNGQIYDLSNALVAELSEGPAPTSSLVWDGKDESGKPVPGGIYLYQIDQDGVQATGTVVVAR